MPVRQSAYAALQNDFYAKNPTQGVGAGMLSKGYLIVIPATPTSNEQRDTLTTELNNIAAGRADPKTGLDRAAAKMADIMTTG
jgi:ABC-type glycerol-3-phosphate transport system substrate-binding protein